MMFQISTAVQHLHSMSIAHRGIFNIKVKFNDKNQNNLLNKDLKPENLLLSTDDERGIIKLCDFGFAKESSDGLKTPW